MGLRLGLLALGVIELLFPRRVVDWGMRCSIEDGEAVEVKPWVYTAARLEGFVIALWALRRGRVAKRRARTERAAASSSKPSAV